MEGPQVFGERPEAIKLAPSLVHLTARAMPLITDWGGVQEEAANRLFYDPAALACGTCLFGDGKAAPRIRDVSVRIC